MGRAGGWERDRSHEAPAQRVRWRGTAFFSLAVVADANRRYRDGTMVFESALPVATSSAIYVAYVAAAAAILSSILSFVASTRSNRNARKQLERQLRHNAEQQNRERGMSLRRDVYLPAVEALVRSQGVLGEVVNPDSDLTEIGQQLVANQATMAKIHLVGGMKTVRALMAYINELMPAYLELSAMRLPIDARRQTIATEKALMDRSNAEQQQSIELMKQFNLAGDTDKAAWQRIQRQFESERTAHERHANNLTELWCQQNDDIRRSVARMTELALKVTLLIPEAVIAVREEIELPIDPVEYRKLFSDQQETVKRTVAEFLQRTRPPQPENTADSTS